MYDVEGLLFSYRRQITVTEQSGNDLIDYQVLIELNSDNFEFSHANSDGSDIRFCDGNNFLDYWIEKWDSANQEAKIWVKVPNISANGITSLYMYYGNPNVTSASDVNSTFIRIIDGLVGAWHFDEGGGSTTYDSSGNDNDGTIYGATWTDGKFGKALSFDGSNDYVALSHSLPDMSTLTIGVWVYYTGGTKNGIILSDADVTSGNDLIFDMTNSGIGIRANKSGATLNYWCGGPNGCAVTGLNLGNSWHHIVWTMTNDKSEVYVDGELVKTIFESGSNVGYHTTHPSIGRFWDESSAFDYFSGRIDELYIYNEALTSEEISDLYNNYGYTTENYPGKVLVRKYTDPEPSVSIGEEETP